MMFSNLRPLERSSRLWRFDDGNGEAGSDGPLALVRTICELALRHKTMLIACTAVGLVAAGLYANSLPRTYVSSATLLLEPRQAAIPGVEGVAQQGLDLNRADSELQIIRSERLLSSVFDSLGLQSNPELGPQPQTEADRMLSPLRKLWGGGGPPSDETRAPTASDSTRRLETDARRAAFSNFTKRLDARRVGQSYVIEIEYSSSDPALPARVANAAVSAYIMQAVAFKAQAVLAGGGALQGRLDALDAQVDAANEAMKRGVLPAIPTPDADARIIGAALTPLSPASPRPKLIILLGGLLGLFAGSCLVALNFAFDRKILTAEELARETGVPCLGLVPDVGDGPANTGRLHKQQCHYATAIRDLRTSVEIACSTLRSERSIVIALVGWSAGSGVSTLCFSLAQLIRGSGRYVTLFQEKEWPERSNGEARVAALTSLADAAISGTQQDLLFRNLDGVAVLPIHSTDKKANLFADFRSPRVGRLLDAARLQGDVLLDLPALDASKDALALATHADAVLFVATAGKTTIGEVQSALQQLRHARAKVIGTVVTRANL